jgi:hypothetical protein
MQTYDPCIPVSCLQAAFLWHKASAAALRRVAAQQRAVHLAERVTWRTARWALQQWRASVLQIQRDRAAHAAAASAQQAASLGEQLAAAQAQLGAVTAAKEEGEAVRVVLQRQLTEAVESSKAQQEVRRGACQAAGAMLSPYGHHMHAAVSHKQASYGPRSGGCTSCQAATCVHAPSMTPC